VNLGSLETSVVSTDEGRGFKSIIQMSTGQKSCDSCFLRFSLYSVVYEPEFPRVFRAQNPLPLSISHAMIYTAKKTVCDQVFRARFRNP
jgi:hypothetical protein